MVGRYAVHFAPPGVCKLVPGIGFGVVGGAKWSSFRPGGGTLFVSGGAFCEGGRLRVKGSGMGEFLAGVGC